MKPSKWPLRSWILLIVLPILNFVVFFNIAFSGCIDIELWFPYLSSSSTNALTSAVPTLSLGGLAVSNEPAALVVKEKRCRVSSPKNVRTASCSETSSSSRNRSRKASLASCLSHGTNNDKEKESSSSSSSSSLLSSSKNIPALEFVDPFDFGIYRDESLVGIKYWGWSTIVNPNSPVQCTSYIHATVSRRQSCFAVAFVNDDLVIGTDEDNEFASNPSYNLLRYHKDPKLGGRFANGLILPTGFFRNVGTAVGREKLALKIEPLFEHLSDHMDSLLSLLATHSIYPKSEIYHNSHDAHHHANIGNDIIVMVVNDGEMDLFLNFVCSLRAYKLEYILSRVLVFAASNEIIPVIQATGALAIHHESFGFASRGASAGYLDRTFVDMMWYKAFSVWILLKMGFNVLFQDVDLVWFRDPFPYFHGYIKGKGSYNISSSSSSFTTIPDDSGLNNDMNDIHLKKKEKEKKKKTNLGSTVYPEAFFSDDGQRSLRYSPFYANSGFYYLLSSPRTEHFAYSVMTAFDILHSTGSHQNVFTMRLLEGLDLTRIHPKILSLREFATGVQFHHNKTFMSGIASGIERPYNFHMCWTANKADKLKNFNLVGMWFLKPEVNVKALRPPLGTLYKWILQYAKGKSEKKVWKDFATKICAIPSNAPYY